MFLRQPGNSQDLGSGSFVVLSKGAFHGDCALSGPRAGLYLVLVVVVDGVSFPLPLFDVGVVPEVVRDSLVNWGGLYWVVASAYVCTGGC